MLNRFCVGLMAEGMQLTRIVPESLADDTLDEGEKRIALATRIETPMDVLPWMRRTRAARLAEIMDRNLPNVIYAVGETAWQVAMDLGKCIDRPVLLDLHSIEQVRLVPTPRDDSPVAGYIVPTRPIAEALQRRVPAELISVVHIGVALPAELHQPQRCPDQIPVAAIIGNCREKQAYRTLLEGIKLVVPHIPDLQVLLELRGPLEHDVWRECDRLELLNRISSIADASHYRTLLTGCDLLLMPERTGQVRSIVLEAMAFGLPIVTNAHPALDFLIDGQTAQFVQQLTPHAWASAIQELLLNPDAARKLGLQARKLIATSYRSSDQVTRLMETFERTVSGGALPFAAS